MEKTKGMSGGGQHVDRLPYEKPTATRVELKPEELMAVVVCSKRDNETKCGGTAKSPTRKPGSLGVVQPKNS